MAAGVSIAHSRQEEAHRRREDAHRKHVLLLLGLAELGHLARDRRFQARMIMVAIGLAAVASMGRENRANAFERLAAWQKSQDLRLQRAAKTRRP